MVEMTVRQKNSVADGILSAQRGENALRSLNPIYAPIPIGECDRIDCFGKVLRRLEKEWIA